VTSRQNTCDACLDVFISLRSYQPLLEQGRSWGRPSLSPFGTLKLFFVLRSGCLFIFLTLKHVKEMLTAEKINVMLIDMIHPLQVGSILYLIYDL
jgi:hypothetical protein